MYQPSVRDTIIAFFRRRTLFMLVVGGVCLMGGGYLLLAQPQYISSATLVLHFDSRTVPNIDRTMTTTQLQGSNEHREILYSDADILRSPGLIRRVIDELGVARLYPNIASGRGNDARKLDTAEKVFLSGLIVDVGLQSDVLSVSFLHPDPTVAHDAVQHLLDRFFAQEAEVYSNPQLRFAEEESKAAKEKLTAAQNELAAFKAEHKIADLPQQVSQLLLARTDVESRYNVARARVKEAEQRESALKQLLETVPQQVSSSAMGEQFHAVDSAEAQLDQLRAKRSQLSSNYRSDSEVFKQLDAQIASLTHAAKTRNAEARGRSATQPNSVYQSIKTDYLRAAAEATSAREPEQVLERQLTQVNERLTSLEADRNKNDDLTRAVQIQSDTYRTLAIRYETARVEANRNAQKISSVVVVSPPVVPNTPARPRRKLVALATVLAALLAGIAAVLGIEAFDDRFHSPRDVTRELRLPVLATFAGRR